MTSRSRCWRSRFTRTGSVAQFEIFEDTDTQAALERFEEIGAATEPERQVARLCRLLNARDWDGLARAYADYLS